MIYYKGVTTQEYVAIKGIASVQNTERLLKIAKNYKEGSVVESVLVRFFTKRLLKVVDFRVKNGLDNGMFTLDINVDMPKVEQNTPVIRYYVRNKGAIIQGIYVY